MDVSEFRLVFDVIQWLTTLGVGFYVYLTNRHRVTNQRISTLEEHMDTRLDDHADRLARLEQDQRHAPNHDDLKRLHRRLDEVSGEMKEMRGEFKSANTTLSLIHQHLLRESK